MDKLQYSLFDMGVNKPECIKLPLENADVEYYPNFINESEPFFLELVNNLNWQQDKLKIVGKSIPIPRLNAWYGDAGAHYGYSGIRLNHNDWCTILLTLKNRLLTELQLSFNSVLANYYRDGMDSMGWHSDNELELGEKPIIASLSFGDIRRFSFKLKKQSNGKPFSIDLESGSLLLMKGDTQHFWLHQLPKVSNRTKACLKGRINLTFRTIVMNGHNAE